MAGSASGKQVDAEATPGAVRLLFDSLMMRGVVEYNPAAAAAEAGSESSRAPPVFEEAEIVAFFELDLFEFGQKDIRDKAILYSPSVLQQPPVVRLKSFMHPSGRHARRCRKGGGRSRGCWRRFRSSGAREKYHPCSR